MANHRCLRACPFVHARCALLLDFIRRVNPAHRLNAAPRASSALLSQHRLQRALRAANRSGAWVHASSPELRGIHLIRYLTTTMHEPECPCERHASAAQKLEIEGENPPPTTIKFWVFKIKSVIGYFPAKRSHKSHKLDSAQY